MKSIIFPTLFKLRLVIDKDIIFGTNNISKYAVSHLKVIVLLLFVALGFLVSKSKNLFKSMACPRRLIAIVIDTWHLRARDYTTLCSKR